LKYVEDEIINHKISLDPNLEAFELTPSQSL